MCELKRKVGGIGLQLYLSHRNYARRSSRILHDVARKKRMLSDVQISSWVSKQEGKGSLTDAVHLYWLVLIFSCSPKASLYWPRSPERVLARLFSSNPAVPVVSSATRDVWGKPGRATREFVGKWLQQLLAEIDTVLLNFVWNWPSAPGHFGW